MKASSSITISHITDGLTTYYEYAKNSSNTTAPSSGATWSATVPTSEAGKFIWRREGYALPGENPTTWGNVVCLTGATGTKGDPGTAGTSGLNSAVVFLYKRGATAPTKPSTNATYTFATGILTGHNNSWTQAIPATNGQPLWVIQATASATAPTATATILSTAWGTQIKLVEDGTKGDPGSAGVNGLNQATIYLYQRKASVPGVTDIADPITYKFSDGTITGSLGSWSKSVPGGNNPLYVTIAVAIGNGATDTIPRSEWTTPTLMAKDGAKGDPGTPGKGVVSVVTEYALSDSNTDVGVDPDWDTTPPERGAGEYLWTRQIITYTDSTFTITEPICVTGDKGPSGNPGALGVNIDGTTLEVAGYDDEGEFGASTGRVYLGSSFYTLEQTLYTVTENGNGYILGSASGLVSFAKIEPLTDSGASRVAWMEFNTGEEIVGDVVIGEFKVENGVIVEANIVPTMTLDQFITSNFIKLLRTAPNENSTRLLAMAMGVDTVFQSIVAMEAFIRELWVYKMQSEAYSEDALGNPLSGFKFDGETGEGKITNLKARDADVSGKLASDGFKTLEVVAGITRPIYTVPSTIYKHSEMTGLVTSTDERQNISGTVDGYSFNRATRRENKRVLLASEGYKFFSQVLNKVVSYVAPSRIFGSTYYVEYHINFGGYRRYISTGLLEGSTWGSYTDKKYVASGNHIESVILEPNYNNIFIHVESAFLFGTRKDVYSNHLRAWSNQVFNGLVLTYGDSTYKVIPFEPNAYYLSASNPFTIGSTNQDTGSIKKYKSGTDLYNHFSTVPSGKDIACTGKINVNGTTHTVTRLRREANRMVFYAGQEVAVHKFTDGGSLGVYTELAVTQQFVIGATTGGIEAMSILPWANALYDIGEVARKFRSLYLSGEVNANTGVFAGALSAATLNTGHGNNELYAMNQNVRKTDKVKFASIEATGSEGKRTAGDWIIAGIRQKITVAQRDYYKVWEYKVKVSGTFKTIMRLQGQGPSNAVKTRGRVYVNGVARGTARETDSKPDIYTYTENITLNAGDVIQLYLGKNTDMSSSFCNGFVVGTNEEGVLADFWRV